MKCMTDCRRQKERLRYNNLVKPGFQSTQRTQRKERNELTSLLDRPITAASDDGVCRWHAAKVWQTDAII